MQNYLFIKRINILLYLLIFILFLTNNNNIFAQTTNSIDKQDVEIKEDTVFTFISPRPLLLDIQLQSKRNSIGFEVLFSTSGLGFGCQMERILTSNYKLNYGLFFSGKRDSDELEYWDYEKQDYVITGKINRLFTIPAEIGIQRYINFKDLGKAFRPFGEIMVGPAFIWQIPYKSDFFSDLKYSKLHVRLNTGIAIGADFGVLNSSLISFKMKYLYIPYGGDGLESVEGLPIKNFGGFFLSLTLGGFF